jgi:hypothetical protein
METAGDGRLKAIRTKAGGKALSKTLGICIATPVFDGVSEREIKIL